MNHTTWIVCLILLAAARPTFAQSHPALVSEGKAYFFGEPDQIAAAEKLFTSVSPHGKYLLIVQASPRTERFQSLLPTPEVPIRTVSLSVYDARRRRTMTLWKANGDQQESTGLVEISWLSDNETAVVQILHSKQIPASGAETGSDTALKEPRIEWDASLLYVNVPRQTTKRVVIVEPTTEIPDFDVTPSPTRNEALVTSRRTDTSHDLRLLTATGSLQPALPIAARFVLVQGWSADGNRAGIRAVALDKENKREIVSYVWERQTRILNRTVTPDKNMTYPTDAETRDAERVANLPVRFGVRRTVVTAAQAKREMACVVAEGKDGKEQYLLAADAEPVTLLESGENLTAIYESGSALYAVPVYPVAYPEYVSFMRRGIASNAKQIDAAMQQWMFDNKADSFPASLDTVAELVGDGKSRYIKRDTGFRDPKTGAMMFQHVYTGKPDATGNIPRFVLRSSFGTLTMYADGEPGIVWSPVEPPAKP